MLGVYQDPSQAGAIGSSALPGPTILELALGHDAVYIHAGGSPDAYEKIKAWASPPWTVMVPTAAPALAST